MTLSELNNKVWYRILKVIYVFGYVVLVAAWLFGLFTIGREYHPKNLPKDAYTAFNDEKFLKLTLEEKKNRFSEIDFEYSRLTDKRKEDFIALCVSEIQKRRKPSEIKYITAPDGTEWEDITEQRNSQIKEMQDKDLSGYSDALIKQIYKMRYRPSLDEISESSSRGEYNYKDYYTWKTVACIKSSFLYFLLAFVVMETARRTFYYIIFGKCFPPNDI